MDDPNREDVINECISVLEEQRDIYRYPEFAYPNGCINSVITTSLNIKQLEMLK